MTEAEQKILDYQKRHMTLTIVVGVIVLLGLGIYIFEKFYGSSAKVMFSDDKTLRAQVDSMVIHDRQRDSLYSHLQVIHTQDSMRIDDIEEQIDGTTSMINNINNVYNQKRGQLSAAPIDTRIKFLSDHLPKGISTGR